MKESVDAREQLQVSELPVNLRVIRIVELLQDNEKMVKMLQVLFEISENYKQFGFSDFVASRLDAHKKHGWMLRATLK